MLNYFDMHFYRIIRTRYLRLLRFLYPDIHYAMKVLLSSQWYSEFR